MKTQVGKRIRNLRESRGFSQEELADRLNISRSAYERIENGKSNSWAAQLEKLSEIFEVAPEYFLKKDSNEQANHSQSGGIALQNNGNIKTINNLSDKLIEQFELRLKEKDVIIRDLKKQLNDLRIKG